MSSDPSASTEPPDRTAPTPAPDKAPRDPAVKLTRAGALWTSLIIGFLILIVLLIFIVQNIDPVPFKFFNLHWSLPLGVAILLAAICGGLLTVAVGTARILQLRRAAKKSHAAALKASAG
jgi:uncharacterized integral membrane protein